MQTIRVNGEPRRLSPQASLAGLLAEWGYDPRGVAVAVNGTFVPRATYRERRLEAGDAVDVVAPMCGG